MGENKNLQITFHRKKFCQTTCDYLCSKLDADTEEDNISALRLWVDKVNSDWYF